jgi:transcriptional regulator with XRE-family HTH domain
MAAKKRSGKAVQDSETFPIWLVKRMGVLGLKNSDIAEATGVTGPAVSLWRTGVNVPDVDRMAALAEILRVPPETILLKLHKLVPRDTLNPAWDDYISRVQAAGPDAERVVFALIDAYLLATS